MKSSLRQGWIATILILGASGTIWACGPYGASAQELQSENPEVRDEAIASLRGMGPFGLKMALMAYDAAYPETSEAAVLLIGKTPVDPKRARFEQAIDKIAKQKDAVFSRVYWYTDLDEAKQVAANSGRPILSLRLLGQLDEKMSCANSRFFRSTLYANKTVSDYLRENYVLHWESVRPVPKMTIDFGDGRKIEQTITGNSIHYILDNQGRVTDALPGVYSPQVFLSHLKELHAVAKSAAELETKALADLLHDHHSKRLAVIDQQWEDRLHPIIAYERPGVNQPTDLTDVEWRVIGRDFANEVRFDGKSRELMQRHLPPAQQASLLAISKRAVETPLMRVVSSLSMTVASDTIMNDQTHRRQIHRWFVDRDRVTTDLARLNEVIYSDLFLTPSHDPWLGLVNPEVYTGIADAGVIPGAGIPGVPSVSGAPRILGVPGEGRSQ